MEPKAKIGVHCALAVAALVFLAIFIPLQRPTDLDVYRWVVGSPIQSSDIWDMELKWLSGGFGFDHIINMDFNPGSNMTQCLASGGPWVANKPAESADEVEALTCADSSKTPTPQNKQSCTGTMESPMLAKGYNSDMPIEFFIDGTPLCFSWPIYGNSLDKEDIEITLNTGEKIGVEGISTFPNNENNEKHCFVFFTNLGNRIVPKADKSNWCAKRADATNDVNSCAFFPVKFEIVGDLFFIGPPEGATKHSGPWKDDQCQKKNAKGMFFPPEGQEVPHPYVVGPTLNTAHLTTFTSDGDTGGNDCDKTYPADKCQYRLRFFFSGGYSFNGVSGILPTDFENFWYVVAKDTNGTEIEIKKQNQEYEVNGGKLTVIGLSELGADKAAAVDDCENKGGVPGGSVDPIGGGCYDRCYKEDRDNYIDIIFAGDKVAVASIVRLEQPAGGTGCYRDWYAGKPWADCEGYQPLYNPGGGGNVRNSDAYMDIHVAGSAPVSIDVTVDLDNKMFVWFDDGKTVSIPGKMQSMMMAGIICGLFAAACCCWGIYDYTQLGEAVADADDKKVELAS